MTPIQTNVKRRDNLLCECASCHKVEVQTKYNEYFSFHPGDPQSFIYCLACYFSLRYAPGEHQPTKPPTENPLAFFDTL